MNDPIGIALAIPAHDEAETIDQTLTSVLVAARGSIPVVVVVAADACADETAAVARWRARTAPDNVEVHVVEIDARSAGVAREHACRCADARLARIVGMGGSRWIATTDADTTVPPDWLTVHRAWARRGADAVTGLVRVDPTARLISLVRRHLDVERDRAGFGHRHVYGANLGVRAPWWSRVGGFPPVTSSEDELFVRRLRSAGARVFGIPDSVVVTSGRLVPRAPLGFGARLATLAAGLQTA
jgi:glycosyltransferase involved in cell wall biosynthesis